MSQPTNNSPLVFDGIRQRLGTRRTLEAQWLKVRVPPLTNKKSWSEFKKMREDMAEKRLDADHLEVHDFTCVIDALIKKCANDGDDPAVWINKAWHERPLSVEDQAVLNEREHEEREEEAKEMKKTGQVPGQMRMIKDDGSIAEEATAVTTEKLTPENDPAVEKADSKKGKRGRKAKGEAESGADAEPSQSQEAETEQSHVVDAESSTDSASQVHSESADPNSTSAGEDGADPKSDADAATAETSTTDSPADPSSSVAPSDANATTEEAEDPKPAESADQPLQAEESETSADGAESAGTAASADNTVTFARSKSRSKQSPNKPAS